MSRGYTIIEVIVVLVLLTLAASVVAPAFARRDDRAALAVLIARARATAIRRAEAVALRVEPSGAWRLDGLASTQPAAIARGVLSPLPAAAFTLIFSPLGPCAPEVETAAAAEPLRLDPLTCEVTR